MTTPEPVRPVRCVKYQVKVELGERTLLDLAMFLSALRLIGASYAQSLSSGPIPRVTVTEEEVTP